MMTLKQRKVLERYISEDNIKKLDNLGFNYASSFINLIFNTTYKDFNSCSINILSETDYIKEEKIDVETLVNNNKDKYRAIKDEYCSLEKAYIIPEYDKKIYRLKQTWFKGMSNSPTHKYITITEDGKRHEGEYNVLIDLKIYSISSFMDYLKRNTFINKEGD